MMEMNCTNSSNVSDTNCSSLYNNMTYRNLTTNVSTWNSTNVTENVNVVTKPFVSQWSWSKVRVKHVSSSRVHLTLMPTTTTTTTTTTLNRTRNGTLETNYTQYMNISDCLNYTENYNVTTNYSGYMESSNYTNGSEYIHPCSRWFREGNLEGSYKTVSQKLQHWSIYWYLEDEEEVFREPYTLVYGW